MRIALVGLGQIGTSIGMALKTVSEGLQIVGHDPDDARVKRARKLKAVDSTHWNLISACDGAEMIIVDQPLTALAQTLDALESGLEADEPPVVIDTARIKRPVMTLAQGRTSYVFVGGDPVAPGIDGRGEPAADLFEGGVFYLVAGQTTPPQALDRSSNLAQALGTTPRFVDAAEHDGLMAAMTQMPVMVNLAILGALGEASGVQDRADAVGALLASLGTPPVGDDTATWQANRDNLDHWLARVERELHLLRKLVAADDGETLSARVERARALLTRWQDQDGDRDPLSEQPGMLRSMFLGNLGRKKRD